MRAAAAQASSMQAACMVAGSPQLFRTRNPARQACDSNKVTANCTTAPCRPADAVPREGRLAAGGDRGRDADAAAPGRHSPRRPGQHNEPRAVRPHGRASLSFMQDCLGSYATCVLAANMQWTQSWPISGCSAWRQHAWRVQLLPVGCASSCICFDR